MTVSTDMQATIDDAGRVTLPATVRDRAGFRPGMQLDVVLEDGAVRLVPSIPGPELVRVDGRLVARPRANLEKQVPVDVAGLIEQERDRWSY